MTFTRKISQIPTQASPLAGAEKFEVVQGGVTKFVAAADIAAAATTVGTLTSLAVTNNVSIGGDATITDASVERVIVRGSTSGQATLQAPAIAGTPTFTLPDGVGTVGQVLSTDGAGILSWTTSGGADTASDVMFARFNFR
jgi:hypothetical protein